MKEYLHVLFPKCIFSSFSLSNNYLSLDKFPEILEFRLFQISKLYDHEYDQQMEKQTLGWLPLIVSLSKILEAGSFFRSLHSHLR